MEDLDVTENISPVQIGDVSGEAEVDVSTGAVLPVRFGTGATKNTVPWLILCVVLGFWLSSEGAKAERPERAGAYGAQSSASVAGLRIANGRRLMNGWTEGFALSNAKLAGGGNGILESAGVALFVSGLSPYLPQGSPPQPDNYAGLRKPDEYPRAEQQHQFPLHLEFLAWLFFCGFVSWGGAVWVDRR
jgi:hypothetical protein